MKTQQEIEKSIIEAINDAERIEKLPDRLMIYPPKKNGIKFLRLDVSDWSLVGKDVISAIDSKLKINS